MKRGNSRADRWSSSPVQEGTSPQTTSASIMAGMKLRLYTRDSNNRELAHRGRRLREGTCIAGPSCSRDRRLWRRFGPPSMHTIPQNQSAHSGVGIPIPYFMINGHCQIPWTEGDTHISLFVPHSGCRTGSSSHIILLDNENTSFLVATGFLR